jgi:hypothetical protein
LNEVKVNVDFFLVFKVNVDFGYGKVSSAKNLRLILMFIGKSKLVYRLKIKKLNYV